MNPLGWLTPGGAAAATLLGVMVWFGAGVWALAMLFLFLVSGSLLRAPQARAASSPRTSVQVVANGWTAALGALLVPLRPEVGWPVLAGGLAAAQADTWATEIGLRAGQRPVLLTTGRRVPPGTSGAVTGLGSLGGLAGALAMAILASAEGPALAIAAATGGVAGAAADSLLGAVVQGVWRCETCGTLGEDRRPACGHPAHRVRGWSWMDNHVVNAIGTGAGAATAVAVRAFLA